MTVELRWGYPNSVGLGAVSVVRVTPETVWLGVNEAAGEAPVVACAVGDHFEVDGIRWNVLAIHALAPSPANSPPGVGSGAVVALVEAEQFVEARREQAARLLETPVDRLGQSRLRDVAATRYWVQERGGASLIVADDGSVLFANSAVSLDEHVEAFRVGRRTQPGEDATPEDLFAYARHLASVGRLVNTPSLAEKQAGAPGAPGPHGQFLA